MTKPKQLQNESLRGWRGDIGSPLWDFAVWSAACGNDPALLIGLLRAPAAEPTPEALVYLAEILEGRRRLPRRRGVKSRLGSLEAVAIRSEYKHWIGDRTGARGKRVAAHIDAIIGRRSARMPVVPYTKHQVICYLAAKWRVSEATIRDVIDKRRTFSEKSS